MHTYIIKERMQYYFREKGGRSLTYIIKERMQYYYREKGGRSLTIVEISPLHGHDLFVCAGRAALVLSRPSHTCTVTHLKNGHIKNVFSPEGSPSSEMMYGIHLRFRGRCHPSFTRNILTKHIQISISIRPFPTHLNWNNRCNVGIHVSQCFQ